MLLTCHNHPGFVIHSDEGVTACLHCKNLLVEDDRAESDRDKAILEWEAYLTRYPQWVPYDRPDYDECTVPGCCLHGQDDEHESDFY